MRSLPAAAHAGAAQPSPWAAPFPWQHQGARRALAPTPLHHKHGAQEARRLRALSHAQASTSAAARLSEPARGAAPRPGVPPAVEHALAAAHARDAEHASAGQPAAHHHSGSSEPQGLQQQGVERERGGDAVLCSGTATRSEASGLDARLDPAAQQRLSQGHEVSEGRAAAAASGLDAQLEAALKDMRALVAAQQASPVCLVLYPFCLLCLLACLLACSTSGVSRLPPRVLCLLVAGRQLPAKLGLVEQRLCKLTASRESCVCVSLCLNSTRRYLRPPGECQAAGCGA